MKLQIDTKKDLLKEALILARKKELKKVKSIKKKLKFNCLSVYYIQ